MELTRNRLTEIFARYADLKIALVGDLFLDQWFEIDPSLNEKPARRRIRSSDGAPRRARAAMC